MLNMVMTHDMLEMSIMYVVHEVSTPKKGMYSFLIIIFYKAGRYIIQRYND